MDKQLFITGIGTGVGKTIVSAVLCRLWGSSYWKPVQSGDLETSDSMTVQELFELLYYYFTRTLPLTNGLITTRCCPSGWNGVAAG